MVLSLVQIHSPVARPCTVSAEYSVDVIGHLAYLEGMVSRPALRSVFSVVKNPLKTVN